MVPPGALQGAEGLVGAQPVPPACACCPCPHPVPFARALILCLHSVPCARRQLSEELQAARGALEKEAQLLDQARREKEELLYRVLHAGDGAAFPMATGEVPLIAT